MAVDEYVHSSHGWLESLAVPAGCGGEMYLELGLPMVEQGSQLPLVLCWPPKIGGWS